MTRAPFGSGDESSIHRPAHWHKFSAPRGRQWRRHVDQLVWKYGPEHAGKILAGKDEATNNDLAAWRNLGHPHETP